MNEPQPSQPRNIVLIEGGLYFVISALTPVAATLDSDRIMDARAIAATSIAAVVAGCVALKAFFSQSLSK